MPRPPAWFADIRREAEERWTRLEQDRELAAPWWQLFRQVQNPRHVLSELLQNADDAGARRASVEIVDETFAFRHDGRDFTPEDFRALCRFGLSNKRTLHTIGFRGIGFKSTFSLGDRVELLTPTLAVAFEKRRFSLPIWLDATELPARETVVRIRIRDEHVLAQLERNVDEWLRTPLALLFLRGLRTLVIRDHELRWRRMRGAPCEGAEIFELDAPEQAKRTAVVIRSREKPFPPEARDEIREERFLLPDERLELPPCRVDIALGRGWEGGVYAVLPTGVRTGLPFACNAPFLQDPARLHVKEPARSPTNRWLLHRIGRLAARAMLAWLENESLAAEERAAAYALMPAPGGDGSTRAQEVEAHVERAFTAEIRGRAVVLTAAGDLVEAREAIAVDPVLFDVWGEGEIAEVLAGRTVGVTSPHVARNHVERLVARGLVEHRTRRDLFDRLKRLWPPRPESFAGLYALWAYLAPELARAWRREASEVALFPVRHSDRLQKASSCVRFRRSRALDEEDAEFLLARLEACDEKWFDHLQALTGDERRDVCRDEPVRQIEHFLRETGLDRPSSPDRLVAAVVDRLKLPSLEDTVRLARIAAKLDVSVPEAFPYVTVDWAVRRADAGILYDPDERLEDLLPEAVVRTRLLHPVYGRDLSGDVARVWRPWAARAKSRLLRFPLPEAEDRPMTRREFERELDRRAVNVRPKYPYASDTVVVADPDFARELWDHWEHLAEDDPAVWAHVTDCLLAEIDRLEERLFLRAHQRGYTYTRPVELAAPVPAAWIVRLRGKRCLPDGDGVARRPEDVYRRTAETEGLLGSEPFVARRLDGEKTAPVLDLLGVMARPQDLSRILQRLRLTIQQRPEDLESAEKLYRALEVAVAEAAGPQIAEVREEFAARPLAVCADGTPRTTCGLFLANPDGIPGLATLHPRFAHMRLWTVLDIPHRPTADLILDWLRMFEPGQQLAAGELDRVRGILARYPDEVWERTGCWLDLSGTWRPIEDLSHFVDRDDPYDPLRLFANVRARVADMRGLPERFVTTRVGLRLLSLVDALDLRPAPGLDRLGSRPAPKWLRHWAENAARVRFEGTGGVEWLQHLTTTLATAVWVFVRELRLVPYLNGQPVGEPVRSARVALCGDEILFEEADEVRCVRLLAEEVARRTGMSDFGHALTFSYERARDVIDRWFRENFRIREEETGEPREPVVVGAAPLSPTTVTRADGDFPRGEVGVPADVADRHAPRDGPDRPPKRAPANEDDRLLGELARGLGLTKADGIYAGADGRVLRRSDTGRSLWELWSPDGRLLQLYWVRRHCLERQPLEVPAEIWERVATDPGMMTFALVDPAGELQLLTGEGLLGLRRDGWLELFPATYRLRRRQ